MEPTIYLFFNGNCEEAMRFYAETLGGEITGIVRIGDTPDPANRMPGSDDMVMNMNMRLGATNVMASDTPDEWYNKPQGFSIAIAPANLEDAERVFNALAAGGEVTMPLTETFWAERFGQVKDRYGTPWMINYEGAKAAS